MPNSKQIVYLSQAQYNELIANGSITVDGVTVTYDENDIYVTPQAEPVTDVRVDGISVSSNGIANIPKATTSAFGAASILNEGGLALNSEGRFYISTSSEAQIKAGTGTYKPLTAPKQHIATFYGLAKASGDTTQSQSNNSVGTYTDEAKGSIQSMLGITDLLGPDESTLIASKAYAVGDVFVVNGKLYKVTSAIAAAGSIVLSGAEANVEQVKIGEDWVRDVQVNGTSILNNGVANVPAGNTSNYGVVKIQQYGGLQLSGTGLLKTDAAGDSVVKAGTDTARPLVPSRQHLAAFYGLAKAAGDATQSASSNSVGAYTSEAKSAIQSMLGVSDLLAPRETSNIADQAHAVGDFFTLNGKLYKVTTAIAESGAIVIQDYGETVSGANAIQCKLGNEMIKDVQVDETSVISNGVAVIPYASTTTFGTVRIGTGLYVGNNGLLYINPASDAQIKAATQTQYPIGPATQHTSVFYGLAKAAGDTTQSQSSNVVGTYTDNAKASIKSMLGIVDGSTGTVEVTGTTPTITAVESTRYVCGEVSTLSITPPASGICIVRFTSGTTATVLTLPSTVKFPEWFDATTLETNTIYEMCITDGIYGAVMSWAL